MKVSKIGTATVLGRRLARELTLDELNVVGGGGEKEKTPIVDDCRTCTPPKCQWETDAKGNKVWVCRG